MLKLYDKDHNAIGHLVKYKDCKKEIDVTTGDATLSFTYLAKHHSLENEMYIRTREDEYVIKEVSESSDGFPQIVAALNLEELEAKPWQEFSVVNATIEEAARVALAGTGWTIGTCDIIKQRNAGMVQLTSLGVIQNLCTAFMCEPVFDTIGKQVSFYEKRGEDKGVYLMAGLNLKKLQKKSSSYDFYTRIIPIGAEGLTIEPVNGGKDYLENHQYSDKVRTYIWKDESYTDAQALKEDAQLKLNDMSKPEKSYSAQVRDLARQKEGYSILSYGLGDTIKLIDPGTGTMEEQRIVRMTQYEDDPEKNTCEIANTFLTFEEMQQKLRDAAAIVNHTISNDGKIKVSDILKFEQGIADSTIVSGMAGDITTMQGELAAVKTTIGQIETNYLKADEASIKYATIESLTAVNETVHSIQGDYAAFKTLTAQEIAAQNAKIESLTAGTVTTDYLAANYANIKLANVETADVGELLARTGVLTDMTVVDGYVTGQLNGVRINADVITAGTLSVDRLLVTGEDSIVYQINVASSGLSMQELEDEKYQKYLNGTDIVAASITGDRIAGNTITGNHIIANSIHGDRILAGSITGDRIAANAITAREINVNDLFAKSIMSTGMIVAQDMSAASQAQKEFWEALNEVFGMNDIKFIDEGSNDIRLKNGNRLFISSRKVTLMDQHNSEIISMPLPFICNDGVGIGDIEIKTDTKTEQYAMASFKFGYEIENINGRPAFKREKVLAKFKMSYDGSIVSTGGEIGGFDITENSLISATGSLGAASGMIGNLTVSKGLVIPTVGGNWINGKTATNCIYSSTQQTTNQYFPMMRINTASGHVWNIGGIGDKVGMYGYSQSLTANTTSWSTVWDVGTGNLTHNANLAVSGGLSISTIGGTYISGKTATNCIYNAVQQTVGQYFPMMRINTASGHVWNIGGIGDKVGMHGWNQSMTSNAMTWDTEWDVGTGYFKHSSSFEAKKIYTGSIELSEPYPYIDFHFNNSTEDFTSRIIESPAKVLNVNGVQCHNNSVQTPYVVAANGIFLGAMSATPYIYTENNNGNIHFRYNNGSTTVYANVRDMVNTINARLPLSGGSISGSLSVSGTITSVGDMYVRQSNAAVYLNFVNDLHNGHVGVSSASNFGLYSDKYSKWVIVCKKDGTVTTNTTSDRRAKHDLGLIPEPEMLDILRGVKNHKYTYKTDGEGIEQYGLMAQELRDLLIRGGYGYRHILQISLNGTDGDLTNNLLEPEENVLYSIDYSKLIPLLHDGWQYHDAEIEKMKTDMQGCLLRAEAEISALRAKLEQLKQQRASVA